jgi:hypothetical protein
MQRRCLYFISRLSAIFCFCAAVLLAGQLHAEKPSDAPARWYKGNTHAHSFWSDGDEFPEMVADWYKGHGYDFLALSDHEVLMAGEKWLPIDAGQRFVPSTVVEKCQKRFGPNWLQIRGQGDKREVKMKTYEEIRAALEEPGRFLLIQNEEIATTVGDHNIHLNALNLAEVLKCKTASSVSEAISLNVAMIREQSEHLKRPILAHVNHPQWVDYDVTAEDLAAAPEAKFFELCNAYPSDHFYGDVTHPGQEKLWDIANTIRIAKMKSPPLYGLGSDDAHNYQQFAPDRVNPGRAWIVVYAKKLQADALIEAMNRGDFYASTGVILRKLAFDAGQRTLAVEVQAEPNVQYTIEFISTPVGVDPAGKPVDPPIISNIKTKRPGRIYSSEIGKVFHRVKGNTAAYKLTGKELYVRAVVRSDKPIASPPAGSVKFQEAWCQPVGWNP